MTVCEDCHTAVLDFMLNKEMDCMLKIAVCDDEKFFRDTMKRSVEEYMEQMPEEYEIDEFSSGREFLELELEMMMYQVLFLDINMEEIDGIETAKKIRETNREMIIVFVTAYINYTLEGYKVEPLRYLLKDSKNFDRTMQECMNAIFDKMNYTIIKKRFGFNEGERALILDRIIYIESSLHKLYFHVMEQEMKKYTMYARLDEMEEVLEPYHFIRIHKSYLVNMKYIKNVSGYRVILGNGIDLAVPKTRYRKVQDAYILYKGDI